jgi:hypothetical protein
MRSTFLLLLIPGLLAGADSVSGLEGRWRSVEATGAGIQTVFEFGKDNSLDSFSAVILEERYRVVGTDTIIFQPKQGSEQKLELEWDTENHGRIDDEAAGKKIEISRAGKKVDGGNLMTGEWQATHEWNGKSYPARAVFLADGTDYWVIQVRAEHGKFNVNGSHIKLEIQNRPAVEGDFKLERGLLVLPNPRGGVSKFERMEAFPFPGNQPK